MIVYFRNSELNEAEIIVILTIVLFLMVLLAWLLFMWRKKLYAIMKQSGMCHIYTMRRSLINYLR